MRAATYSLDVSGVRPLVRELGAMAPEVRKELRRGFRLAGAHAAARAKSAASWSTRIPGAITVRPLTGANTAGVFLRVNADRAPHGRPYEGITAYRGRNGLTGGNASFRHPVFGRDVWVVQKARPFLGPAVEATRPEAIKAAQDAVTAAARVGRFT